jgi:malate dehydrogenase (oxaloacetate-decarboxylating)
MEKPVNDEVVQTEARHVARRAPSASNSITLRVLIENKVGMIGEVLSSIGRAGGDVGAIDIVQVTSTHVIRDITVDASSVEHGEQIVEFVRELPGVEVIHVSDRTFLLHLGGKIRMENKTQLKTRSDLSMAYTPGVARVCMSIHDDPEKVYTLTIKKNTVAVVTDGTAVLGLGDIGPKAAMPVMEGKAMLFKEFADIDAWPISSIPETLME